MKADRRLCGKPNISMNHMKATASGCHNQAAATVHRSLEDLRIEIHIFSTNIISYGKDLTSACLHYHCSAWPNSGTEGITQLTAGMEPEPAQGKLL
jgi:hypothetical protein